RRRAPQTERDGPSPARPVLATLSCAAQGRATASEPRADAHAHHHRVELGGAGLGAVEADVAGAVAVARVGAGDAGRGEVAVHTGGGDRALCGFHADPLAGQRTGIGGLLVAVVGFVVAQAHERAEGVVGRAEVVLAAQRIRLPVDAGGL